MTFIRNSWYVAEWAHRLEPGKLLPRRILDEPVVLFRTSQGIAAFEDKCPHRFAPLSFGRITATGLQCGYHGLVFDATGRCVHNPHGEVPRQAQVRPYTAVEKHGLIWIWMGDATQAKEHLIPDFAYVANADPVTVIAEYMLTRTNYQIYNDNILDLSHTDYLHPTSLGSGAITTSRAEVTQQGDKMTVRWWCPNVEAPVAYAAYIANPGHAVDFCIQIDWHATGNMELVTTVTMAGQPQEAGIQSRNAHFLTPETQTSTHYFYFSTRNYNLNAEATQRRRDLIKSAFEGEDRPMVEAVQSRMGTTDLMSLKPILLSTDVAAIRARRIITTLVAREQAALAGAPSL